MSVKIYEKEDVKIVWDQTKCIHSGNCVRALPAVFNPKSRPWINVDGASKEEIVAHVAQCPSGALSIREA